MNVCVIGGGNIGTALACYIKKTNPEFSVRMLSSKPASFGEVLKCNDWENQISFKVSLDVVSNDYEKTLHNVDLIFVTLPHFAIEDLFEEIAPFVPESTFVCIVPASGGCEYFFERYFGDHARLIGFQRVPFVARVVEYGHEVDIRSWKDTNVIGALRKADLEPAIQVISACGLPTTPAPNFLSVSLVPSNPILHTSRLYQLFGSHDVEEVFEAQEGFYSDWTDRASEIMLAMDDELQMLIKKIDVLDLSAIKPLSIHYESPTKEAMTQKISHIPSFQGILTPMVASGGGYKADLKHRMFVEDFPYGLTIIKALCELFEVSASAIDEVLSWYANYLGFEYYREGKFSGKDLASTSIPQNYGITTPEQLISVYTR